MEKFFIVTDKCKYKKDYLDYQKNITDVNEVVKEFFNENNIETSKYYLDNNKLYIIPTDKDTENYGSVLNKPVQQGLRAFKKTSKISKMFYENINNKGLKILNRPSLWMYMNGFYGSFSTVTSLVGDTMYLKIDTEYGNEINETGMNEIKASEYYLALGN